MAKQTSIDSRPKSQQRVYWLVKLFVIFHMFMVVNWTLPKPPPALANGSVPPTLGNVVGKFPDFVLVANQRFKFATPAKYYMMSTGLWQYWDMFSPNPANVDFWWDSIVTYKSGAQNVVKYPRMKDLGIFEKYFKERYRKYLERVNTDATDAWKRPTFAQRMALIAFKDPQDPPVRVQLRRHYRIMPAMDRPVPDDYVEEIVFDYIVDQEKLARDARR